MGSASAAPDVAGAALGAVAAALILAAPAAATPGLTLAAAAFALAWIVWRDGVSLTIPDGAVAALALVGVAARVAGEGATVETALALMSDVALTGGVLWLLREAYFRWRGHDGLGFGDVKLAAAAGCLIGAAGFAFALLAASLTGLAIAALRGTRGAERIAFGVLLAPAVWAVLAAAFVAPELLAAGGAAG